MTGVSSEQGASARSLKRRYGATADLSFFTPSSLTFNPKPYFPHSSHSVHHKPAPPSLLRDGCPLKPSDPTPDDPSAFFIHPPFDDFPDAHLYPEGLTYNILAENPEWFLDPADFRSEGDTNPDTIPYPQQLEPPRGWCPTKKKDARGKGPDAWQDADAPKLRCTFCRRKYAGVNAKSMWRRHVLEKHKIPMSNRRDVVFEGGRNGRGANKENRRIVLSTTTRYPMHPLQRSKSASVIESPESNFSVESLLPPFGMQNNNSQLKLRSLLPACGPPQEVDQEQIEVISPPKPFRSPEFTVDSEHRSPPRTSPRFSGLMLPPSSPLSDTPSQAIRHNITASPYNPTQTPNLGRSKQPFKQPWKFPSPSHPLHLSPEELCLGVPVAGMAGEGLSSNYVAMQSSPFPLHFASPLKVTSSPSAKESPLSSKLVTGRILGWKRRSADSSRRPLPGMPEPEPRLLDYKGPLPVPVDDRFEIATPDLSMSTDLEDFDTSFSSIADPLSSWFNFGSLAESPVRKPSSFLDALSLAFPGSPVMRTTDSSLDHWGMTMSSSDNVGTSFWESQPSGLGLGITIPSSGSYSEKVDGDANDDEDEDDFVYPPLSPPHSADKEGSDEFDIFTMSQDTDVAEGSPSSDETGQINAPPLKRRRTIW